MLLSDTKKQIQTEWVHNIGFVFILIAFLFLNKYLKRIVNLIHLDAKCVFYIVVIISVACYGNKRNFYWTPTDKQLTLWTEREREKKREGKCFKISRGIGGFYSFCHSSLENEYRDVCISRVRIIVLRSFKMQTDNCITSSWSLNKKKQQFSTFIYVSLWTITT